MRPSLPAIHLEVAIPRWHLRASLHPFRPSTALASTMADLADALTYFAVFLFSTTLHEASHAWAALRGGDPTAYHGGQLSLDPWPHIRRHPVGMVLLPLV